MAFDFTGKTAIVTGGTQGIGAGIGLKTGVCGFANEFDIKFGRA